MSGIKDTDRLSPIDDPLLLDGVRAMQKNVGALGRPSLAKILEQVEKGRRPARRLWWTTAALTAVAAAAIAVIMVRDSAWQQPDIAVPPPAMVLSPTHALRVVHYIGAGTAGSGPIVQTAFNDSLTVPAGTHAHVRSGERLRMSLAGPSHLRTDADGRWRLADGSAALDVAQDGASQVSLRAGGFEIIVAGARFTMAVSKGELRSLRVESGMVSVRAADGSLSEVVPGSPMGDRDSPAFTTNDWPDQAYWEAEELTGALRVTSEPPGASVTVDGQTLGETPLFVRWPAGSVSLSVTHAGYQTHQRRLHLPVAGEVVEVAKLSPHNRAKTKGQSQDGSVDRLWRRARRLLLRRQCERLDGVIAKLRSKVKTPNARADVDFMSAECLLRSGRRQKALAAFQQLQNRYPGSPSARNASFEVGILKAQSGDSAAALKAFSGYVAMNPGGGLVAEAIYRQCEIYIHTRDLTAARTCLANYQSKHPSGLRRRDSLLLSALLEKRAGANRKALSYFGRYFSESPARGPRYEKALFQWAQLSCVVDGGKENVVAARYQREYPQGKFSQTLANKCGQ